MPPKTHATRRFGAGERLDQGGVAGTSADDELTHPGPEAALHHIKRRFPCVHRAVLGHGREIVHPGDGQKK
jgi:hypothetical protein